MNVTKLNEAVKASGLTAEELSHRLGIDPVTYDRKVSGRGDSFTVAQAKRLAAELRLSPARASEIFFR